LPQSDYYVRGDNSQAFASVNTVRVTNNPAAAGWLMIFQSKKKGLSPMVPLPIGTMCDVDHKETIRLFVILAH
jgi:hypothetical protein